MRYLDFGPKDSSAITPVQLDNGNYIVHWTRNDAAAPPRC